MPASPSAPGTVPVGTIIASVLNQKSLPVGWLPCDGSAIPPQYQRLMTLLSSKTTPNLIGRTLIGAGALATASTSQKDGHQPQFDALGTALQIGDTGGECAHTLTTTEMPTHSHTINRGDFGLHHRSFEGNDDGDLPYETNCSGARLQGTDACGDNGAHNNVQPYFSVTYIIYAGTC